MCERDIKRDGRSCGRSTPKLLPPVRRVVGKLWILKKSEGEAETHHVL